MIKLFYKYFRLKKVMVESLKKITIGDPGKLSSIKYGGYSLYKLLFL